MRNTSQFVMTKLFEVYHNQCSDSEIRYALYDDSKSQGHIVLKDSIEIIHFPDYQGGESIKFAFARGDEEYFFDTYSESKRHFDMDEESFEMYVQSITI